MTQRFETNAFRSLPEAHLHGHTHTHLVLLLERAHETNAPRPLLVHFSISACTETNAFPKAHTYTLGIAEMGPLDETPSAYTQHTFVFDAGTGPDRKGAAGATPPRRRAED